MDIMYIHVEATYWSEGDNVRMKFRVHKWFHVSNMLDDLQSEEYNDIHYGLALKLPLMVSFKGLFSIAI